MKIIKYLLVIIALNFSNSTFANSINCELIMKVAGQTMQVRQMGVPMKRLIDASSGNPILIYIIEEAYRYSKLDSEEYAEQYVMEFADRMYRECRTVNNK